MSNNNNKFNQEWENKLDELEKFCEKEISNSLYEMKALGLNIDEKFGKMFVRIVKNR